MSAMSVNKPGSRELRVNEPMSKHTSWRVGGPADQFFRPASLDSLIGLLKSLDPAVPVHWFGLGSNVLVRDGGIRGVVIQTTGLLRDVERVDEIHVRAQAGVACTALARRCLRWKLGGGEFFAGIPGTVGGALTMNAGAFGGETWECVVSVTTLSRGGEIHTRTADDYEIGYRSVNGPGDEWFLDALFGFEPGSASNADALNAMLERRKRTQPLGLPSCGSVFRNPEGDHAARLIEACGLKGAQVGGAVVSEKHANFVINTGDATAADIETLLEKIAVTVEKQHGVRLQREVRIVGEGL